MTHCILCVIGTRPEAVKMAPVVHALRTQRWAEVRVLATAQHRGLLDDVLRFFAITPDRDLDLMRPDQSLAGLTAGLMHGLDPALAAERPAFVLAQGDTTTVVTTALACAYRRIPFGHVEAGLRSHDLAEPFPEELNRRVTATIAALHFAPTVTARDNLLREGVPVSSVHVTGNTVVDALAWARPHVAAKHFAVLPGKQLVLVTAHRRESFGAPLQAICAAVRRLADRPDVQVVFPVHPNPNVHDDVHRLLGGHPSIRLCAPLDYPSMLAAMRAATLVLTDSGGVQEEAPSFGVPVLVLRATTERPEGVAAGVARLVGTDTARIAAAASDLLDSPAARAAMVATKNPYGDGKAAGRIADALAATLQQQA